MINFAPLLIIGSLVFISSKTRGKRKKSSKVKSKPRQETLPPARAEPSFPRIPGSANFRGTVFIGDPGDAPGSITADVGETFSVSIRAPAAAGPEWVLKASPPDDSINFVRTEIDEVPEIGNFVRMVDKVFVFKGVRPGSGSLVFHNQYDGAAGTEPPQDVVEIITQIV